MKKIFQFLALAAIGLTGVAYAAAPSTTQRQTPVEVVFVLDTTGSMGGLIQGAKDKIWSIAGNIVEQSQGGTIRMGLVAYRDLGDDYVTKVFDLTEDLDSAYGHLREFQAAGGGDGPESVNQALYEAVTRLSWSKDARTLRLIFLVGDFPPHMDYPNDVKYPESCKLAVEKGIFINTVQCGNYADTVRYWKEIARLGEGSYAAIVQDGGVRVIDTPYDADIAKLSVELDHTVIAFGSYGDRAMVAGKISAARSAPVAVQADRQWLNAAMDGKVVQGKNDLVQEIADGNISIDMVKEEQLSEDFRKLSTEERTKVVAEKKAERDQLNKQLMELNTKRRDYIAQETKKREASGVVESFDAKVSEAVGAQLEKVAEKK